MKILFLLEDYNLFYTRSVSSDAKLANMPFDEQLRILIGKKYYQSDSLANAFSKLGHECKTLIPDCNSLQLKWAKENSIALYFSWILRAPIRSFIARVLKQYNTFDSVRADILIAQIEKYQPDVVYFHSSIWASEDTLKDIKRVCKKLVLQWSCPIEGRWKDYSFRSFDLIVTSAGSLMKRFSEMQLPVCFMQQAFDDSVLKEINDPGRSHSKNVVFVGSFSPLLHKKRIEFIDLLLEHIKIDIYCPPLPEVPAFKRISENRKGSVGGVELYKTYQEYKIALHMPGDEFQEDAGAKRLFEVTGVGTLLITLNQDSLAKYFRLNEEIVTFSDVYDCQKKIEYYLTHENERMSIAHCGQQRTLISHTFVKRAEELLGFLNIHK